MLRPNPEPQPITAADNDNDDDGGVWYPVLPSLGPPITGLVRKRSSDEMTKDNPEKVLKCKGMTLFVLTLNHTLLALLTSSPPAQLCD